MLIHNKNVSEENRCVIRQVRKPYLSLFIRYIVYKSSFSPFGRQKIGSRSSLSRRLCITGHSYWPGNTSLRGKIIRSWETNHGELLCKIRNLANRLGKYFFDLFWCPRNGWNFFVKKSEHVLFLVYNSRYAWLVAWKYCKGDEAIQPVAIDEWFFWLCSPLDETSVKIGALVPHIFKYRSSRKCNSYTKNHHTIIYKLDELAN